MAALSKAELAAMAEEATVDAYGDDEQAMGFHAMIVDNLKTPFVTSVLGVEVAVGRRRAMLQLRTAAVSTERQGCHDRS